MSLLVDETLPYDGVPSEVVLHVRRHLRRIVGSERATPERASALAMLFGFSRSDEVDPRWERAVRSEDPFDDGAEVAHALRPASNGIVWLGHDAAHLEECRRWLIDRKQSDDAFARIRATDLATLLELSRARDRAVATRRVVGGGSHYLPILIEGATGTGKELLAQAIHAVWAQHTKNSKGFHVVQVSGMPESLIEDELFGHVRGGFTGAIGERVGRIEIADGGTLLIDEVGDLPRAAQLRLLRFLESGTVSRVGETKDRQVNVRIIAATWHQLDDDVAKGRFREDLLHRLRVGAGLMLPPLRERERAFDDVLSQLLADRGHLADAGITRSARDALANYSWPGNLRELTGVLDEAVDLADGGTIRVDDLPPRVHRPYLAKPLHERALGVLLDPPTGKNEVSSAVAFRRVGIIQESLDRMPMPPPRDQMLGIAGFLGALPDPGEDHGRTRDDLDSTIRNEQLERQLTAHREVWFAISEESVPEIVSIAIQEKIRDLDGRLAFVRAELAAIQSRGLVAANPWLRLVTELQSLSMLQNVPTGQLAGFVAMFMTAVRLAGPEPFSMIKAAYVANGLEGVRSLLAKFLSEADSDDESAEAAGRDGQRPRDLTHAEWQSLSEEPTLAIAQKKSGFSPKTIDRYLTSRSIVARWKPRPLQSDTP